MFAYRTLFCTFKYIDVLIYYSNSTIYSYFYENYVLFDEIFFIYFIHNNC